MLWGSQGFIGVGGGGGFRDSGRKSRADPAEADEEQRFLSRNGPQASPEWADV